MEKTKKRIRMCLLLVVLAALFIGIVYYYYNVKDAGSITEGTLIAGISHGAERLVGYVCR